MFDSLVHLASGSPWTYAIVCGFAAADVIAPIVPSETLVVAAGALSATGRLNLGLVLLAAIVGAVTGDNGAYAIGRRLGGRLGRHRAHERVEWAREQLRRRGGTVILVARFIPGGRTVTMLAAGALHVPWRRFALLDLAAATAWALYAGLIGFFGGKGFENEPVIGVGVAVGVSLLLGVVIEVVRRLRNRRRP